MSNKLTFGQEVKNLREAESISRNGIAAYIGISPTFLREIEEGIKFPTKGKAIEALISYWELDKEESFKRLEREACGL